MGAQDIPAEHSAIGECASEYRQSEHRHHAEETAPPAPARDIIVIMIGAVSSANRDGLDICVVAVADLHGSSLRDPVERLRSRPAPAHLLRKGLILDNRNTILPERPSPSSALHSKTSITCDFFYGHFPISDVIRFA